jgi:hypothetical protein
MTREDVVSGPNALRDWGDRDEHDQQQKQLSHSLGQPSGERPSTRRFVGAVPRSKVCAKNTPLRFPPLEELHLVPGSLQECLGSGISLFRPIEKIRHGLKRIVDLRSFHPTSYPAWLRAPRYTRCTPLLTCRQTTTRLLLEVAQQGSVAEG